jgi:NAD(P)H-dependent FMN reductase
MPTPDLLFISGSARSASLNLRLAQFAAARARALDIRVSHLDLRALALPIYDGDLEAASGVPPGAQQLQQALLACDGVLIAAPEYNGFPAPLLINAFDWLSRIKATPTQPSGLATTDAKPVALLSASPGLGGGLRAMNALRLYLQMAFAMIVVPRQFALARAHEAFDDDGALRDAAAAQSVDAVVAALVRLATALKAAR